MHLLYRNYQKSKLGIIYHDWDFSIFSICDFIISDYTRAIFTKKISAMEKSVQDEEMIKKMPNRRAKIIMKMPKEEQEQVE
jgi:hypothetical protein